MILYEALQLLQVMHDIGSYRVNENLSLHLNYGLRCIFLRFVYFI